LQQIKLIFMIKLEFKNPFAAFKYFTKVLHTATTINYTELLAACKFDNVLLLLQYLLTGYREYYQLYKLQLTEQTVALAHKSLQQKPYIDPEPILRLLQMKDLDTAKLDKATKKIDEIYAYVLRYFPFATKQEAWYIYTILNDALFETALDKIVKPTKKMQANKDYIQYINIFEQDVVKVT